MTLKSKSNFLFSICTKLSNFYQLSDANLVSHLKMSLNLIPFQHKNLQKTPKSHITTSDLLSNENVACSLLSKKPGKKKIIHKTLQCSILCTLPPEEQAERSNVLISGYPDSFNPTSEKRSDYLCNVKMTEVTHL